MATKLIIEIEDIADEYRVSKAFAVIWGLFNSTASELRIIDTRKHIIRKRGDNKMAYDVTAITTAIAEGKVDEVSARQLIADYYDWEIKVAQLLTPSTEGVAVQPEETPAEPPVEQPTETVDLAQEAQPTEGEQPTE